MAVGNTIGRMVGQSPAKKSPMEMANPIALLSQGLQQLIPMFQQLQGMIQQLMGGGGGGGGGGGSPSASAAPATPGAATPTGGSANPEASAPFETPEALRQRLTELGQSLRTRADSMDGPARPDQSLTRSITESILGATMTASGPRGSAVHEVTLQNLGDTVTQLAGGAPSAAQSAQAIDNAATMARMRGAGGPVLQMLQQVLGMFQQALSLIQGLKPKTNGAQIKKS